MGIAFSPCGELAVTNDEGRMMSLVDQAGSVAWFLDYNSFGPPFSYVAMDPDGTVYASEAVPDSPPTRVVVLRPGEFLQPFVDADWPSGVARRADGALFVSETAAGRITRIDPDGSIEVVVEGLAFPEALALDAESNLYVVTGPAGFAPQPAVPVPYTGDTITRITPEGEITTVGHLPGVVALTIGPGGDLFATVSYLGTQPGESQIVRISSDGTQTVFAGGFEDAVGMAFDIAGNLYVADTTSNGIVRIGGFPQGTLSGVVTDASGVPVEGARVQALSVDPIVVGQVVFTDTEGRFTLPAAPRTYSLTVTHDDVTVTLEDVAVSADEETALEIAL
jgi:sugar lactone lactonase YvrE